MQHGWCQPVRQESMENECEALPGVAYPGVRDNRSTLNTKTGYDDDDDDMHIQLRIPMMQPLTMHTHLIHVTILHFHFKEKTTSGYVDPIILYCK